MTSEVMEARKLDGKPVAEAIRASLVPRIERFFSIVGRPPGLGIVLAGDDGGSEIYQSLIHI